MKERIITRYEFFSGTLSANAVRYAEYPFPVTYIGGKGAAENDSSATVAISGAAGGLSIAAKVLGDSGDPASLDPTAAEKASTCGNNANSLITITLDYDGSSATAAANCWYELYFETGEA